MSHRLIKIAERIRSELAELDLIVPRILGAWDRCQKASDDYYLDSVALNLHGLYSGLERIFEIIAGNIDANKPSGVNWHQVLLNQMAKEIPQLRPAVISARVCSLLQDYKGFRHIVRNVYTYRFDVRKIEKLVTDAPDVFAEVKSELLSFATFLEESV
jgi:HepT-like protein